MIVHLHAHFLHTPASVTRYAATMRGLDWTVSAHAKDIWTTPEWEKREKLADAALGGDLHRRRAIAISPRWRRPRPASRCAITGWRSTAFRRPAAAARRRRPQRAGDDPLGRPRGRRKRDTTICSPRWRGCRRILPGGSCISAAGRCSRKLKARGGAARPRRPDRVARRAAAARCARRLSRGRSVRARRQDRRRRRPRRPAQRAGRGAEPGPRLHRDRSVRHPRTDRRRQRPACSCRPAIGAALTAALAALIADPRRRRELGVAGAARVRSAFDMEAGIDALAARFGLAGQAASAALSAAE